MNKPVLVHDLNEFRAKLKEAGDKLVVVDFYATWCGPCKAIAPVLVDIAQKNENVVVLKVDVDESGDIAQEYEISAMPTFKFFKREKKVGELVGANAAKLTEMIQQQE